MLSIHTILTISKYLKCISLKQSSREANNYYNLHRVNFVVHHDYYDVALHLTADSVELVAGYLAAEKTVVLQLLPQVVDIT